MYRVVTLLKDTLESTCHGFLKSAVGWRDTFLHWLVVRSLLHKTPLVQPQPAGLSWAAQRRRPHIHRPSVVETPRIWTTVHVRISTWRTPLRVQPYVSHVSSATRSVTSTSGFARGLLPNLRRSGSQFSLPSSWLYPSGLLLTPTSPVSSDRLAVYLAGIFLPHAVRCKTLKTRGQYKS